MPFLPNAKFRYSSMQAIAAILEEGMARVRTIIEELVVSHGG